MLDKIDTVAGTDIDPQFAYSFEELYVTKKTGLLADDALRYLAGSRSVLQAIKPACKFPCLPDLDHM